MVESVTIARLLVRIGADAGSFAKGLKNAEKILDKTAKNLQIIGTKMSVGLTAPLLAASGAALKFAMDAVESENLFEVSMGGMANAAREWSTEVGKALGLNSYELRRSVGEWNVLLTNMQLGEQQSFAMAKSLTQLAADMASFYNFTGGAAEASEKLRSIMAGETEVARRLGIDVSAAAVKTAAYTNGIAAQGTELTEQQKILARYQIVLRQTSNAQGDLARTLTSPTNQLRALKSQVEETAVQFGQALIPFLQASLPLVRDMADGASAVANAFQQMDEDTRAWVVGGAAVLASLGPLTGAFGIMTGAMSSVVGAGSRVARSLAASQKALIDQRLAVIASTVDYRDYAKVQGNLHNLTRRYHVEVSKISSAQYRTASSTANLAKGFTGLLGVGVPLTLMFYELSKNLLEITGWDKEITEFFGLAADAEQEWVDQLTENQDVYLQQLNLYNKLREKLGLTGDEYKITADHTAANVKLLTELLPKVQSLHRALFDQHAAQVQANQGMTDTIALQKQMKDLIAQQDGAIRSVIDRTREYYGVLTQGEVEQQISQLLADFRLLKAEGISTEQLVKGFKDRFAELGEVADDYIGLNMPWQFQAMYEAAKTGGDAFADQVTLLGTDLPKAGDVAMTALQGSIVAGITKAKEGVKAQTEEMDELLRRLASNEYTITVKAELDTEDLQRQQRDAGIKPQTGGGVPWGP